MQATFKNINYGTITAGGDVHIGDKVYVVERDFPHSILFLRIEKSGEEYEAMLSVKGPDDASVPLLREKVRLPIDGDLFEQVDIFQDYRRGAEQVLRLQRGLVTAPQTLEISLPTFIYQSFFAGDDRPGLYGFSQPACSRAKFAICSWLFQRRRKRCRTYPGRWCCPC